MDGDTSEDDGLMHASIHTSEKEERKKDSHERYRFKREREEGEIESDVSSTTDSSPARSVQTATEGLFSEKTHSADSVEERMERESDSREDANPQLDSGDDIDEGEISRDAPDEFIESGNGQVYREVKAISSSNEDMSSEDEDKRDSGKDSDVEEKVQAESDMESSGSSDDGEGGDDDNDDDNDDASDEDTRESRDDMNFDDAGKTGDIIDISDSESSIKEELDHSERRSAAGSVAGEMSSVEMKGEQRQAESESESDGDVDTEKPRSLIFKKTKQSKEKAVKRDAKESKYSDDDSEEVVVDHLDIAAPQQALLRKPKKKSKGKSHDKMAKSSHKSERSDVKDDKKRLREDRKKVDDREKEKKGRYDEYEERKHRKYDGSKYEKKAEHEVQKSKSISKTKRTEEDLRRRALQASKRPTKDEASKDARIERDWNKKEAKSNRKEKIDKNKDVSREKEGKGKSDVVGTKDKKEHKKEREKIGKGGGEKGKKRHRDKTKSGKGKRSLEDEDSEEEVARDEEYEKPAPKRARSADLEKDENKEDDDEHLSKSADADYDDISPASSEVELSPPPSPIELKKPTYYPAIMGCRDVKEFQWLNKIEEGTYGVVYRARDNRTDEIVALKRLKMEKEKEGFPITSLREINTLLKAQHPNIVTVREIVVGSNMDKIYIVMDYVEHDLKALMETMTQPFLVGEVKTLMIQLLRGVNHLHDNWILHRDIKASNLLLSHKGILKVGDFGLAREYGSPLKNYTPIVVTLWYRAPELLLGAKEYKTAIDLWSVGCVFAELLLMKPLFPGKSEIDQINKIFKELGTPNDNIWPGPPAYSELSMVKKTNFAHHPYNVLRNRFGATFTDKGFNLLNRFLTYDPQRRITAEEALSHEYFEESPLPVDPSMFPTWPAKSELAHRAVRKHNASPKPPEGGAAASKLANEDSNLGFHMPAATKGFSAKGAGFNLRF
ncbi:cyclin-dependent kinase 11A-like [Rhopilema esculentum]|uniref:cyclin-dependent kinase 11A-like n=1 Tax=Rhopilema esculentum TaxID=499914 RepID=UPI0031DCA15D